MRRSATAQRPGNRVAARVAPRRPDAVQHPDPSGAAADSDREPGLASMQAAAHPAKANYLFFVRKLDRVHHFFTASEREFINYLNANGY